MPTSVCSALIGFGAVLTAVSATWGAVVAGLGASIEFLLFIRGGIEP